MELIYYSSAVILLSVYVLTKPNCPPNTYYDSSTRNCDSCGFICTYPEIQGTVDKCKNLCPVYIIPKSTDRPIDIEEPISYSTIAIIVIVVAAVISATGVSYCLLKKKCAKGREKQQVEEQTLELFALEERKKPVEATENNPASQKLVAN